MTSRAFRLLLALLFFVSLATGVRAQATSEKMVSPPKSQTLKVSEKTKAARAANKSRIDQQKALALSLLVSLANDARSYPDQKLRARTLGQVADALWSADADQGRALFRKAWDAAEFADQETARLVAEERATQQQGDPKRPFALVAGPDLRAEVLRLAARRDRVLGEEFLDKLKDARTRETTGADSPLPIGAPQTPAATRQRLALASQLIDTDVDRALQFAEPVLGTITSEGLDFLSTLREKNVAAADQRYARMLAIAEADLNSDANTISLLASYLFTPHLFITFGPEGGQQASQTGPPAPAPAVTPEFRAAFFRTAGLVLLRPSAAREQDRSTSGAPGKYAVIKRLLPLFEQYAAKEVVDQLRGELAVISQGSDRQARETDDGDDDFPVQRGITPDRPAADVEKALLDRIDRAKTAAERDAIYLQLATRTAQKGDMRARDFTEKIDDSEMRKQARPYVDITLAFSAVGKKDTENALTLAAKGDLSHIQRVWLLTEVARALPPATSDRALELVAEAAVEARRIDGSDSDRPRALVAVANAFLALDRPRAWETMLEVVKASNSVAGFNGEDGRLMMRLQTPNMTSMRSNTIDEFNLPGVFKTLSQENATQAIELARSFEGEAPRATALIAVARALLSEKAK
ncbi:MAG: hypothetical protein QOD33_1796 [Pyrinomonadaceae bacterium]|jgi:hypothetical protein|nr:hypothetical protein [Pyrinomonadaceae bacterium]